MVKKYQLIITILALMIAFHTAKAFSMDLYTDSDFLDDQYKKTISMDFKNESLNNVLKMFSQQAGMNFIAETDVASKKVNLYFENVPVEEALERILSANNLTYEITPGSNIFVVKDREQPERKLISRVYKMHHVTLPSSNLAKSIAGATNVADSANGLISTLRRLLSDKGSITEDSRTNSIIVTDYPIQFPEIEKTIARLDVKIPQILIEAEILDVSKGALDQIGAKFAQAPMSINGPSKEILWPFDVDNANSDAEDVTTNYTYDDTTGELLSANQERDIARTIANGYTAGSINFAENLLTLEFLRTHSDTKNLARPRILTLNNQTAEIKVTTNQVVGLTTEINDNQSTTTAERQDTGVSLKVTPQADLETREITLAVLPESIQTKTSPFSTDSQSYQDPETQSTKSVFRVPDGDTVIIGGLLRNTESSTETKVPFIGDIPILGRAFKHNSSNDSQRELIVFITPSIIEEGDETEKTIAKKPINNFINITREQSNPATQTSNKQDDLSYLNTQGF